MRFTGDTDLDLERERDAERDRGMMCDSINKEDRRLNMRKWRSRN